LYPVAVDPASPYAGAIAADHRFRVVEGDEGDLAAGRIALLVEADRVLYDDDTRSLAAVHALGQATRRWLEERLTHEGDVAAAFPIEVSLLAENAFDEGAPAPPPEEGSAEGDGPGNGTSRGVLVETVTDAREGLTPSEVDPPFPVRSLLLTFAFLIPMNLVAQLYSGSLLADRTRDRGLILLSAPLSGPAILLGRTLPYALIAVLVVLVASWLTGAGPLGVAAGLPMVLVVVALAMVLGLLARNERELTFLLTGATTMVSTFLFLPAVFTQMPAVAFVSPVSVVAASIEGDAVSWGAFLYATAPITLVTVALATLGLALYREETLFSAQGLGAKAMDGLSRLAQRGWQVLALGAFAVPFALALELFVLALVIPLGLHAAFPAFIFGVAFVEEALKLLPVRAHVRRGAMAGWKAGVLSGTGFFLGEKLALLVALVGFGLLPFGDQSLALWGVGPGVALLVGPLLLHASTAALSGSAARRGKALRTAAYVAAVVVHAAYNVAVVVLL
jgi:ABC-type Na+ efflux pump permease subunit